VRGAGPDLTGDPVPDVVAPPPHHPRFPLTVGLRGIPAVCILLGHAWFFSGGFDPLDQSLDEKLVARLDGLLAVFFVLSGFLLYRPMVAHRNGGGPAPKLRDYSLRRFLRLYPAYWVVLTALALYPGLHGVWGENWWAFYSLTDFFSHQSLHEGCPGQGGFYCGLPQSWTLGVDLLFYIALPFYAALLAWLARGRDLRNWMRIEFLALGVLSVASLAVWLAWRWEDFVRFTLLGHFYWFALGIALAVISVGYRPHELPRALRLVGRYPGACWLVAFGIYLFTAFTFYPAPFTVAPLSGLEYAALILAQGAWAVFLFLPAAFANPNRGVPAKVLGHPVLMWIGVISYGILLWHVTIAATLGVEGTDEDSLTAVITSTAMVIPLAATSYYLVERPLMKLKYRPLREVLSGWPPWRRPAADAGGRG
jgi:peptidoglycan/LPS O-acetylase OafA/YrhL